MQKPKVIPTPPPGPPRYHTLAIFILLTLAFPCDGQQAALRYLDSLGNGIKYVKAIDSIRNTWIDSLQYDRIQLLDPYVDRLPIDTSLTDSTVRLNCGKHGNAYRKYTTRLDKIEEYFLMAHAYYDPNNRKMHTWIETNLGSNYHKKGDLEKALYYGLIDIRFREVNDKSRLPRKYANIAAIYFDIGDYSSGANYYELAISESIKQRQKYNELFCRANMAEKFARLDSAEIVQREAEIIESQIDGVSDSVERAAMEDMLLDLNSWIAFHNKNYALSADLLRQKFKHYDVQYPTRFRREYAKLANQIAKQFLEIPNVDSTRHYIDQGFKYLTQEEFGATIPIGELSAENSFMELYQTLAEYFTRQYLADSDPAELDSAIMSLNQALYVNAMLEAQISLEDSKLLSIEYTRVLIEQLVENLFLKQQSGEPLARETLLDIFRQSKGLYLDKLRFRRQFLDQLPNQDSVLFVNNMSRIAELKREENNTTANLGTILKLQEENDSLIAHVSQIPAGEGVRNSKFIDYLVGEEYIYALDNFTGVLRFIRLGRVDSVEFYLGVFHEKIHEKVDVRKDVRNELQWLYQDLLGHYDQLPRRFQVFPDDVLSHLPFDVLIDANGRYLVENHVIAVRLSDLELPTSGSQQRPEHIVCSAPYYGEPVPGQTYERGEISPLKFTGEEVETIRGIYRQVEQLATLHAALLSELAAGTTIFHYAGHARSDQERGQLILELGPDGNHAKISGTEIAAVPWNLDLATLSACETGLGQVKKGEGTLSLARAFHEGGTRNVVSTLWNVNDVSALRIVAGFYTNLDGGDPPAVALQKAKKTYLRNAIGQDKHPYYWSGFVLSTTGAMAPTQRWTWWWLVLGIVLIGGLFWYFKK